jgi:hypothetical protein
MVRQERSVRPQRRSGGCGRWVMGCFGVLLIFAVVMVGLAVILWPRLPNIIASVAGLAELGRTEDLFAQVTPVPSVALENAEVPDQVVVDMGNYGGEQRFTTDNGLYEVVVGSDVSSGAETALVTFDEPGLLALCQQRSPICNNTDSRFQNISFDLRPGGVMIYADANLQQQIGFNLQQRLGLALRLDASRTQFEFAGIDVNGQLYNITLPEFADEIARLERDGNALMHDVSVNAGDGQFNLSEVIADDTTLTLVLR